MAYGVLLVRPWLSRSFALPETTRIFTTILCAALAAQAHFADITFPTHRPANANFNRPADNSQRLLLRAE